MSRQITNENDVLVFEDLNVKAMQQAKSIAKTGQLDLVAAGIVARVIPTSQQKQPVKTKVFELSKLGCGAEKKEVA